MAFDGIITYGVFSNLKDALTLGKIEKIYQPDKYQLLFHIHTKNGRIKLLASADSSSPRLHITKETFSNPSEPSPFCMLLRKHLQGGRIERVEQVNSERILELYFQVLDELGFTVSKKLVFEIMGKHSNIILVDVTSGKILDSIKRVSIDVNRARQLLPGLIYQRPPSQNKVSFKSSEALEIIDSASDDKEILDSISGISPAASRAIANHLSKKDFWSKLLLDISNGSINCKVYLDDNKYPKDFHILRLDDLADVYEEVIFDDINDGIEFFFTHRQKGTQLKQQKITLEKTVSTALDKLLLKKKRISEDIISAKNSDNLRLYGELLTANLHLVPSGEKSVKLVNYYNGENIEIPLDIRLSPAKNAQNYYKKYGKAMTTIKEKSLLLENLGEEIAYLNSVLGFIEKAEDLIALDSIHRELVETGYIRKKKIKGKEKKIQISPKEYISPSGLKILVGKNNKENDILTLKKAGKSDLWFHTKDIPGSHVILFTNGDEVKEDDIKFAASIAALYSKASQSANVPVDYVRVKYIKKPAGAKPGMVIFKNNNTIYVDPFMA